MDWADLVDAHCLDISSETLRKAGLGVKRAAEGGMLRQDGRAPGEYEAQYKAKKQFFDQRREYHALLTKQARQEHLAEVIRDCAAHMNQMAPLTFQEAGSVLPSDREAVLVLSDWHYGMVADNIWNKYNVEICKERVEHVVRRACVALDQYGVGVLHVVILGDMAAGAIHTSCRVASEENTCEQLMHVSELLAQAIAE